MDLSKWKVTLPVNKSGNLSGDPYAISPAKTYKPWFIAGSSEWKFRCPTKGATTENTTYTRSELGQINTWKLTSTVKSMKASLAVKTTPGRIMVGQVHADKDELMKVCVDNGSVYIKNEHDFDTGGNINYYFSPEAKVDLNQRWDYSVKVSKSAVIVTLTINGVLYPLTYKIHPYWLGSTRTYKFRAGIYCTSDSGSDANVSFYSLNI